MIERYKDPEIEEIWSNEKKLELWQDTEFAAMWARVNLLQVDRLIVGRIEAKLLSHEIDIEWWLEEEKKLKHDLNAFLKERMRFLTSEEQQKIHEFMTSYDTEESAFISMLKDSVSVFKRYLESLIKVLEDSAKRYRYTIMNSRTHGQEGVLQSLGKRFLTWLAALRLGQERLSQAEENLEYSKLSGAVGNYQGLEPDVEKEALRILGFKPFYGATQIMPRELYVPLAQAIAQIVATLDKIATDIRLGARSGRPIFQEPFGKKQMGSSVMAQKKNTISSENTEGMNRMAEGFSQMIAKNQVTWEERSIEQSSVERVAWPDLFHVAIRATKTTTQVLEGLVVYPGNMLREIIESCGTYASPLAKEFLRNIGAKHGLDTEDAYRIIQLASFNALGPDKESEKLCQNPPTSFEEAEAALLSFSNCIYSKPDSIQDIIADGRLVVSSQLSATEEVVKKWNSILSKIFENIEIRNDWSQIFMPSYILKNEDKLYKEILGI